MANGLLEILRYFLLALIWLFIAYAARTFLSDHRRYRLQREAALAAEGAGRAAPEEVETRPQLRLRVAELSDGRPETYDVGREVTVGRGGGCTIRVLADSYASSLHARVFPRGAEVWVEDLGSTNGTYLNERRLDGPVRLKRGDRVRVGGTVIEVIR